MTGWTGLAALRVPLERASGPRAVTLDLPGYWQTNPYGCRRIANQVYLANNGLPFFARKRVSRSAFQELWEPGGNGLVYWRDCQPIQRWQRIISSKPWPSATAIIRCRRDSPVSPALRFKPQKKGPHEE